MAIELIMGVDTAVGVVYRDPGWHPGIAVTAQAGSEC